MPTFGIVTSHSGYCQLLNREEWGVQCLNRGKKKKTLTFLRTYLLTYHPFFPEVHLAESSVRKIRAPFACLYNILFQAAAMEPEAATMR